MDDRLLVRRFERLRDLPRDWEGFIERDWPARDAIGQRLALDQERLARFSEDPLCDIAPFPHRHSEQWLAWEPQTNDRIMVETGDSP